MHMPFKLGQTLAGAIHLITLVLISGCAIGPEPINSTGAGLNCIDDTPHCVSERQAALRILVGDKSRAWVREPATPQAYASGVRLFAFRQIKRELSCEDLSHGHKEAEGAPAALKSAGAGLTPAQISRGTMFASEVGRELGGELKRRCKQG